METLSQHLFVRIYMIASMAAFVWFGLAFPVGARRGSRAGASMLVGGVWAYLAVIAGTTVWAFAAGEWARFVVTVGAGVLFEMAVFVAIWQFIIYFMASRYLSDKRRQELRAASATETANA